MKTWGCLAVEGGSPKQNKASGSFINPEVRGGGRVGKDWRTGVLGQRGEKGLRGPFVPCEGASVEEEELCLPRASDRSEVGEGHDGPGPSAALQLLPDTLLCGVWAGPLPGHLSPRSRTRHPAVRAGT